ncbi:hypothetical protein [Pseudomonas vlassakiae]|uniref:Uncharacterized protein n=1 Tax=Pseudomonas vlassakiae TaxID=485888 RepID=A0A923GL02_9PSED|nr:hypothetical protein [Pseudomonas vlassakiae]MBV4541823.1 hypothetical protein [Pseudomonas vlassakiae]
MNAINQQISQEQRRLVAVNRWFMVYDDVERRRHCPSSHHEALLGQADEMDRLGLIGWREWRDLRRLADRAFLKAIAGADYHRVPGERFQPEPT